MRKLGSVGVLALVVGLGACSQSVDEEQATSLDELRSDPSAAVTTNDPSVKLLSGYNAFLDQAATTECVSVAAQTPPSIGSVQGSFYLRHVTSREELAKELDVDIGASVKAAQGSGDASTKIVSTFKTSATTVNFLVRAYRTYVASNTSDIELSPTAMEIVNREHGMAEFLQKCGGSFAKAVRYDAQVIAMIQFEAKTEVSARSIALALGGSTPQAAKPVASASVDLKAKAEQTAAKEGASLSITVTATGFLTNGKKVEGVMENSFEKIDELHKNLAESFDKDLAADRADYFGNNGRNVRPGMVMQAGYTTVRNAPVADFNANTQVLAKAENYVRQIIPAYSRMQRAFEDEIQPFLADTNTQWRYNLFGAPKLRTTDLVPIAQQWAAAFAPNGTRESGSLVDPLKEAVDACTSAASNGDYSACAGNAVARDRSSAETRLADYAKNGRILPTTAWMPVDQKFVSYYNADNVCADAGMRLPKRDEMKLLGPAVTALSGDSGNVWFAGDSECRAPYFENGSGQGKFSCGSSWNEWMPWVDDRQVLCVAKSGAVAGRNAP